MITFRVLHGFAQPWSVWAALEERALLAKPCLLQISLWGTPLRIEQCRLFERRERRLETVFSNLGGLFQQIVDLLFGFAFDRVFGKRHAVSAFGEGADHACMGPPTVYEMGLVHVSFLVLRVPVFEQFKGSEYDTSDPASINIRPLKIHPL